MMNIDKQGNPISNIFCEHLEIKNECSQCNLKTIYDKEANNWVKQLKYLNKSNNEIPLFNYNTFNEK